MWLIPNTNPGNQGLGELLWWTTLCTLSLIVAGRIKHCPWDSTEEDNWNILLGFFWTLPNALLFLTDLNLYLFNVKNHKHEQISSSRFSEASQVVKPDSVLWMPYRSPNHFLRRTVMSPVPCHSGWSENHKAHLPWLHVWI